MFNTLFYEPLYNALVALINVVPGYNVGLAIVILTILVKFALLPLSHKSSKSQAKMKEIEPEIQETRDKHSHDKQAQAQEVMKVYQKHGVNPFAGCFLIILQMPIIIALYFVFMKGLPEINLDALYSFVTAPGSIDMLFLGVFDLSGKSIVLALLAAGSQFLQMKITMPVQPKKKPAPGKKLDFKDEFAQNMTTQMRYILPGIIFVFAYTISAAVALYWAVSSGFSVIHEWWIRRKPTNSTVENTNKE